MPKPKHIRPRLASSTLAIAMVALAGCDSNTPATNPRPSPVANPSPDNKLSDITLENESANMDRIKKAGEGK